MIYMQTYKYFIFNHEVISQLAMMFSYPENEAHLITKKKNPPKNPQNTSIIAYLFVTQARNSVNVLLLDHECCQVGCVTGQEDNSEEGPNQHHDLTRSALWVLNWHRIVEDNPPKQPYRLPNGKGWPTRI